MNPLLRTSDLNIENHYSHTLPVLSFSNKAKSFIPLPIKLEHLHG